MTECQFPDHPKTTQEVGTRLDYLRSQGKFTGQTTIGEAAKMVGTTTDQIAASKRFYQADRRGR